MAISARHTHSFDDFLTLVRARRRLSMFGPRWRYPVWFAIYLAAIGWVAPEVLTLTSLSRPDVWMVIAGGIVAMAVLIALVDLLFDRVLYRLAYRRLSTAGADITLDFEDDAIAWRAAEMSGRLPWSAVKRVVEMPEALVLFIGKIEGMVVPRRAFSEASAYDKVRAMAREKVDGAS
jgi:hypothetical protein